MKKIFFLMLITCAFSPLINAYEYMFMSQNDGVRYEFYTDENGILQYKQTNTETGIVTYRGAGSYINLYYSRREAVTGISHYYSITPYLKSDLQFLNDFYLQYTNQILNYLYNKNSFGNNNYIVFDNYELLYNSDGLAVESIVDGVWAGIYDDNQKTRSGAMYNKNGSLVYYNGKEVTPVTSFLVWLQKFTNKIVVDTFEEIQRSHISGIIAAVVLVLAIVRFVLELLPSSITPRRRRYYGGGRGSLPDYGDGSQVSASVRASLAAKNRALKARAYDRSGVEQSTINGILFDLGNEK